MTSKEIKNYAELLKELRESIDFINMFLISYENTHTETEDKIRNLITSFYRAVLKILKKV